jgi:hypothetical protein
MAYILERVRAIVKDQYEANAEAARRGSVIGTLSEFWKAWTWCWKPSPRPNAN